MREDAIVSDPSRNTRRPAILLDISRVGVSFTSAQLLPSGEVLSLEFGLPGHAGLHQTTVEVVHSSASGVPSGYRVGARFLEIGQDTTDQIMDFVTTAVHTLGQPPSSEREPDGVQQQANQAPD